MPITFKAETADNLITFVMSGKLTREDYENYLPKLADFIESHHGIAVYVEMIDFEGWTLGALWDDVKFDAQYADCISRVAMVGEKKWQKWMAEFSKPFTTAEVKYFDLDQREEALEWARAAEPAAATG